MRNVFASTRLLGAAAVAGTLALAAPAFAQDQMPPLPPPGHDASAARPEDPRPEWRGGPGLPGQYGQPAYDQAGFERARADWLAECRSRHGNGNKVGGVIVGGVLGGVIGHEIAGRGDKTLGTVAGAAVGAVAGGAIGAGADKRSRMDWCESYLESHMSRGPAGGYGAFGQAWPAAGYGYAYAWQPVMVPVMVPVMMPMMAVQMQAPPRQKECKETIVTEEWVPVKRPHRRYIPARPVPDKRVRIVPDKRVRVN